MRIFNWFKKIKQRSKKAPEFSDSEKEDIDFYIDQHVSAINMGLRGMTDKVGKLHNTALIRAHLYDVVKDGYTLGFQEGKNDLLRDKLNQEIKEN